MPAFFAGGREQLADLGRLVGLRALEALADAAVARRGQRAPLDVVDELRLDPAVRAMDDEARPLRRAGDLAAHTAVPPRPGLSDRERRHRYARFPIFRRTYSPW